MKTDLTHECRRWCKGDEEWSQWRPCTAEEAKRRRRDGTFEVRELVQWSPGSIKQQEARISGRQQGDYSH